MGIRPFREIGIGVGLAIAIVVANVVILRRLWASPMFGRSQKLAQTILIWLIPGSFLAVRHFLIPPRDDFTDDPTVPKLTGDG